MWLPKSAFCITGEKCEWGVLKDAFFLFGTVKALEHFVDTDSVSMLLTSTNVRSVSSPGSRKKEVYTLAFCIRLPIGSHCFALAQGQKRGWWTKTDNRQKKQVSLVLPSPPPWCLMKKLNVLEVTFVVGL